LSAVGCRWPERPNEVEGCWLRVEGGAKVEVENFSGEEILRRRDAGEFEVQIGAIGDR